MEKENDVFIEGMDRGVMPPTYYLSILFCCLSDVVII